MKNRILVLGTLVVMAGIATTGCAGTPAMEMVEMGHQSFGFFGEAVMMPVKDFETLGLVFTESVFINDRGRLRGEVFTYQALLREAHALGADAIINVVIDRRSERIGRVGPAGDRTGRTTRRETWRGSALAIRYTHAIIFPLPDGPTLPVNTPRDMTIRGH
ncbi:MAG: hypothetical protein FWD88_07365 [Treponema sp.]|nr:hypothetical protein [Treponema sp.]